MQNYAEYCKVALEYSVFCNIATVPDTPLNDADHVGSIKK